MKSLLNLIEKNIQKNTAQKMEYIVEYTQKESTRNVYINGGVYEENKIDLIFLIDTGDWFNKTIRFDIATNTHDNMLVVRKGYGYDYVEYKRADFKKIIEYINNEVYMFSMENANKTEKKLNKRKIG